MTVTTPAAPAPARYHVRETRRNGKTTVYKTAYGSAELAWLNASYNTERFTDKLGVTFDVVRLDEALDLRATEAVNEPGQGSSPLGVSAARAAVQVAS